MNIIENLSKIIVSKTSTIIDLDKDQQEILEYGALSFLQTLISIVLLTLLGMLLHSLFEILVISLTAALLRQYSGGVHATSSNRCTVLSLFFFGLLSLFAKYFSALYVESHAIIFQVFTLLVVIALLYKFAPTDSPNKRITNPEKILKLKRSSFKFVIFLSIISLCLWFIYFKFSMAIAIKVIVYIHIGMLWQALSITSSMKLIVSKLDSLLIKLKI